HRRVFLLRRCARSVATAGQSSICRQPRRRPAASPSRRDHPAPGTPASAPGPSRFGERPAPPRRPCPEHARMAAGQMSSGPWSLLFLRPEGAADGAGDDAGTTTGQSATEGIAAPGARDPSIEVATPTNVAGAVHRCALLLLLRRDAVAGGAVESA